MAYSERNYKNQRIKYVCLIMTDGYIKSYKQDILAHENIIEKRLQPGEVDIEQLSEENRYNLDMCRLYGYNYALFDDEYELDLNNLFSNETERTRK